MFSANMADIDKILNVKPKIKFKTCYDLGLTGRFAGNVCQNLGLAVWANVGNVRNVSSVPDVSDVPNVPPHIYISLPRR